MGADGIDHNFPYQANFPRVKHGTIKVGFRLSERFFRPYP